MEYLNENQLKRSGLSFLPLEIWNKIYKIEHRLK